MMSTEKGWAWSEDDLKVGRMTVFLALVVGRSDCSSVFSHKHSFCQLIMLLACSHDSSVNRLLPQYYCIAGKNGGELNLTVLIFQIELLS